jgi:putative ABC transport system ATP-binding protein
MALVVETKHIAKTYADGTQALKDVSFEIADGEFLAIMGPSGSGKSTLLHILGLLDAPSSGEYRFEGVRVDHMDAHTLARIRNERIGFVFQQFNLLPHESVLENVFLPLYYSGVPRSLWLSRATAVIEEVGLSHRIDHEAYKLSGGEKQRVAIARALINNPRLIFADEPTGNLDSVSGSAVMDMFVSLHNAGRALVLITHDAHIAEYAEKTKILRDGTLADAPQKSARKSARPKTKTP